MLLRRFLGGLCAHVAEFGGIFGSGLLSPGLERLPGERLDEVESDAARATYGWHLVLMAFSDSLLINCILSLYAGL